MCTLTMTDQKQFKFAKNHTTTLAEFDELFKELFNRTWIVFDKEYNLAQLGWSLKYNSRKKSLGVCKAYKGKTIRRESIEISKTLLKENLDKAYDFEDTIRHEFAHAIQLEIEGKLTHDRVWKSICRQLGADDSRTHEGFLTQPKGKYTLTCPNCGTKVEKYRKIKRKKACGKCCIEHGGGRFDSRFVLIETQNY